MFVVDCISSGEPLVDTLIVLSLVASSSSHAMTHIVIVTQESVNTDVVGCLVTAEQVHTLLELRLLRLSFVCFW